MDIGEFHNKVNEPQVTQLIDNVLDAVLALKARLAGLEHGFEFHWGCQTYFPGCETATIPPTCSSLMKKNPTNAIADIADQKTNGYCG